MSILSRLLQQLQSDPPRTGRMINEKGQVINEADAFDSYVNARTTIDSVHASVHAGIAFDLSKRIDLGSLQTIHIVGSVQGNPIHFNKFIYNANTGGIEIRLLKDVVFSGGTPIFGVNRNTLSDKVSTIKIYEGATVTDIGTELNLKGLPTPFSGGTPAQVPQTADDFEWILKPDTNFAIEIKEIGTAAKILYADMLWYEPGLLT